MFGSQTEGKKERKKEKDNESNWVNSKGQEMVGSDDVC